MGYYINPKDVTKEEWLSKHGKLIPAEQAKDHITEETLPVCLVDNGRFTAAGVAFDSRELAAFTRPDGRPKIWFSVSIPLLYEVGALPKGFKVSTLRDPM